MKLRPVELPANIYVEVSPRSRGIKDFGVSVDAKNVSEISGRFFDDLLEISIGIVSVRPTLLPASRLTFYCYQLPKLRRGLGQAPFAYAALGAIGLT